MDVLMAKLSVEQALLRAAAHMRKGEAESAKALYDTVLVAYPKNTRAQKGLEKLNGVTHEKEDIKTPPKQQLDALIASYNLGRFSELIEQSEHLIAEYPSSFLLWNILAAGRKALGQLAEAEQSFRRATELNPTNAEVHNNMGVTLRAQGKLAEAIAAYHRALEINPANAEAHYNMGNALQEQGKLEEAVSAFHRALEIKPTYADAHNNMGVTLKEQGKLEEALASYAEAIRIKPDYAEALYNRGLVRLRLHQFRAGFVDHLYRWNTKESGRFPQKAKIPRCEPDTLRGNLLLWAEQGIGDEVFYANLLPKALTRDVSITLSADKRLHPILARSFPEVRLLDKAVLMQSSVDQGYDVQAPIGNLGYLLELDADSIRATRSVYFKSDLHRREGFGSLLSSRASGLVCGIAWKSANQKFGADKSVNLSCFRSLLATPGVGFVNLQYGEVDAEIQSVKEELCAPVHQIEGLNIFNDIDGLLALIDACDVVITTSNVTAHLAGSIGKRAAVLVPYGKGRLWYWHDHDKYSLWYPSLRLFYQDNPFDWENPIAACSQWVRSLR